MSTPSSSWSNSAASPRRASRTITGSAARILPAATCVAPSWPRLRALGYGARGHFAAASSLDLARLAVRAGIARPTANGTLAAPFLERGFRIGAISTDYRIALDRPLEPNCALLPTDPDIYMGVGGTQPGWHYADESRRPVHMGRYPMETIKRVDEPTTLVIRAEIGRIAKRERLRFAYKHPLATGMQPLIRHMVPLQGTREKLPAEGRTLHADTSDRQRNAESIKALGYYLGADFVAICRTEPWMYYSHDNVEGKAIDPYHEYAVVMLIDQGYETMEGTSGDDWISATQSMNTPTPTPR